MATAKQLVPGIHALGKCWAWEGKTIRAITIAEACDIAEKAHGLPFVEEMAVIHHEIKRVAGMPFYMLAS